jgi:hypothetical protein
MISALEKFSPIYNDSECFSDDCIVTDEEKVSKESDERPVLRKDEVETVFVYIQSWSQR